MDLDLSEKVQQSSGYFVPPLGSSSLPLTSRDVVFPSADEETGLVVGSNYVAPPAQGDFYWVDAPEAEEWNEEDEVRHEDDLEQGTSGFARRRSTPIHEAAFVGDAETLRRLLDQGSPVDARTERYSKTPLHEVCRRRHKGGA